MLRMGIFCTVSFPLWLIRVMTSMAAICVGVQECYWKRLKRCAPSGPKNYLWRFVYRYPIGLRVGLTVEDNIQMATWLMERGVDFVDCSGGGATPAARSSIGDRTARSGGMAGQIRSASGIKIMAVGAITDAHQAEKIIATGQADIASNCTPKPS